MSTCRLSRTRLLGLMMEETRRWNGPVMAAFVLEETAGHSAFIQTQISASRPCAKLRDAAKFLRVLLLLLLGRTR